MVIPAGGQACKLFKKREEEDDEVDVAEEYSGICVVAKRIHFTV